MPELPVVSVSFKVGSWVLDSSTLQFQHHYSVESWGRFGWVPSSVGCKKALSCLPSSWSPQSPKGPGRTLALPGWEGAGGSSCCLCVLWCDLTCRNNSVVKGKTRVSSGSRLRTESPNVLSSVRGYWTSAAKTFGLLFCNRERMTSMEFTSLRDVSFLIKLPAEGPIEESMQFRDRYWWLKVK